MCNCNCRFNCLLTAVITAVIAGVVAAFLQILGLVTITPTVLLGALGIGVVFLAVGVLASANMHRAGCCRNLNTLLAGVLGTIAVSLLLLAIGITATSILSAVLVGLLLFFLWLTFAAAACLIRCNTDCD